MRIILVHPEIPQNTGNIMRTCRVTGTELVLVAPLGFSTGSKELKRAHLDYGVPDNFSIIEDIESYLDALHTPFIFLSTKSERLYTEEAFTKDHTLIFGAESKGLAPIFHTKWKDHGRTIPMVQGERSLNLSVSAGIVLYEALRQTSFTSIAPPLT